MPSIHDAELRYTRGDFQRLRELADKHCGLALADGRSSLVYSRLAGRLRQLGMQRFSEYCDRLEAGDSRELDRFVGALTTHVTSFFRERHHFDFLAEQVVPEWERTGASRALRIWSAGCSTGQEVVTIAMTLKESMSGASLEGARIVGWDIDPASIATARVGIYDQRCLKDVPQALSRKYFLVGSGRNFGKAKVKPYLHRHCEFQVGNLVQSWGGGIGPYHAIFCRNVLIYFNQDRVRALCERFADSLLPGGYLFLGHSEGGAHPPSLSSVHETVYRKELSAGSTFK